MKKQITEKQIVDHIIANWDQLFEPELLFYDKEHAWTEDWRCDITAYIPMTLGEEYGFKRPYPYKSGVFIEVKYDSNSRDLIYELTKALNFIKKTRLPHHIGVISNDFSDIHIVEFLESNHIHMWLIEMEGNDLQSLKLKYINTPEELQDTFRIEGAV